MEEIVFIITHMVMAGCGLVITALYINEQKSFGSRKPVDTIAARKLVAGQRISEPVDDMPANTGDLQLTTN